MLREIGEEAESKGKGEGRGQRERQIQRQKETQRTDRQRERDKQTLKQKDRKKNGTSNWRPTERYKTSCWAKNIRYEGIIKQLCPQLNSNTPQSMHSIWSSQWLLSSFLIHFMLTWPKSLPNPNISLFLTELPCSNCALVKYSERRECKDNYCSDRINFDMNTKTSERVGIQHCINKTWCLRFGVTVPWTTAVVPSSSVTACPSNSFPSENIANTHADDWCLSPVIHSNFKLKVFKTIYKTVIIQLFSPVTIA